MRILFVALLSSLGGGCSVGPVPTAVDAFAEARARDAGDWRALPDKASGLRESIEAHLVTPEGLLSYRVTLPPEDPPRALHSDTLAWSSLWTVAEILRYRVLRTEEAANAMHRALRGLQHLARVSGTPGLLARTMVPKDPSLLTENPPPRRWVAGQGRHGDVDYSQYLWKTDNSKCMVEAWFLAMLLGIRECQDTTLRDDLLEDLRDAARRTADADYHLTEADGQATRWGDLRADWDSWFLRACIKCPVDLLPGFDLAVGPGAMLAASLATTHDYYFDDVSLLPALTAEDIGECIRDGVYAPFGYTHYGNDFMSLMAAWTILETEPAEELAEDVGTAVGGLWRRHRNDRNPMYVWIAVLAGQLDDDERREAVAGALRTLYLYPMDRRLRAIDWRDQEGVRSKLFDSEHARHAMPVNLLPSSSVFWKTDPTRVLRGAPPKPSTHSGADFLLAYWLYRDMVRRELLPADG